MWTDRNRSDETHATSAFAYDTDEDEDPPPPPPPPETPPPPPPMTDIPLSDDDGFDEEAPSMPPRRSSSANYGTEPPEVELELRLYRQLERARNKEEKKKVRSANGNKKMTTKRWSNKETKSVPPHVEKRRRTFTISAIVLFLFVVVVGLSVGLTSNGSSGGDNNAASSATQGGGDGTTPGSEENVETETTGPMVFDCLSMELEGVSDPLPNDAVDIFEQEYCAHFQDYYNNDESDDMGNAGSMDGTDLRRFVSVTECSVKVYDSTDPAACGFGLDGRLLLLRELQQQSTTTTADSPVVVLPFSQTVTYESPLGSNVQLSDVIEGPFQTEESRDNFAGRLRQYPFTTELQGVTLVTDPTGGDDGEEAGDGSDAGDDGGSETTDAPETVGPSPSPTPGDDETAAGGGDDGEEGGTGDDVPVPSPPEGTAQPTTDDDGAEEETTDSGGGGGPNNKKPKPKPGDDDEDDDEPTYGWDYADEIILSRISPPQFPEADFFVTDFGADGLGDDDSSKAFRDAIDACNEAGGGRVVVPEGTYLTGPIHLKSNVNLHLMEGATIEFSTDEEDYEPLVLTRFEGIELNNYSPLIYAYEQTNVAITGLGVLDGRADSSNWWGWVNRQDDAFEQLLRKAEREDMSRNFGDNDYLRPNFVQPYRCTNFLIEGVTIKNSPMWAINPVLSTNVIVRGVTVESDGPDNDGVSVESCSDVLIEDSTFDVSEDCVSIKSGRNADGRRVNVPSKDVVVRNVQLLNGRGGLTIGSEVSAGVSNVYADNLSMDELDYPFRIKTNSVRGGVIENIYLREITVAEADEAAIHVDFEYAEGDEGDYDPLVQKIEVRDFTSSKTERGLYLRGYERAPIKGIRLINVDFGRVDREDVVEHVEGLKIRDE